MNLTLQVWRQNGPTPRAASSTYEATDVSPDMSFLEMLDVLNEQLIAKGEEPDRVRSRLPRGHLRHRAADDQRRRARPGARHDDLPAAHAPASRTATRSASSRGARGRSR